jgi:DNA (cytosine-5)-methyltransferase 1
MTKSAVDGLKTSELFPDEEVVLKYKKVLKYRPILKASTPSRKPRLLDLFCCAGGAGMGYKKAGFEVVGVDISAQPHNPLPFIQADALNLDPKFIATFDAIHASPPCQSYSDLAKRNGNAHAWPRLIEPVREMLIDTGLPYVIENVEGAPLIDPVVLCGTMFPRLRVLRHRLFEANFNIVPPPHKKHPKVHTFDKRKSHYGKTDEWKDYVQVTGGGNCTLAAASEAMGINWMTKGEINESIPPAYTELIGRQLLKQIYLGADEASEALRNA